MKCIVVRSEHMTDWWTIERAEHDGREWDRPTRYGSAFMRSARLGEGENNYCIEGTGAEMLALSEAIEQKSGAWFKRCAATWSARGVALESPRNSVEPVLITHDEACALAADIRAKVPASAVAEETAS